MIEVRGLTKSFGPVRALQGVDLDIRPGTVTGLVGPNGCGKTTLIRSILGLVIPDSGAIRDGAVDLLGNWEYRRRLGYMPQNPDFPGNLRLDELFAMLADVRRAVPTRKKELVERLDLGDALARPFGTLSGGTKQKAAAVAALMFDPEVLILDEPTVGLDPVAAAALKALALESAMGGKAVLFVSHVMSEMQAVAGEVTFILEGRVSFQGSLPEILGRTGASSLEGAVVSLIGKEPRS